MAKSKKEPLVTFVLPTWNAGFVINQTIDSLFEQDEENFECIIVDDGSTDSTSDILDEINDRRFKIITLKERGGAGRARNIGNEHAQADIICVTDAGDIYYRKKVLYTVRFFNDNKDIDIMCSATDCIAGNPSIVPRVFEGRNGERLGFEHPGVAYKKEVTENIKYRETSIHTDQYDAFFNEAKRFGYRFGVYLEPLSSKCTFGKYDGGRDLDEALLVKIGIYREFGIEIPQWLIEHENKMKGIKNAR